MSTQNTERQSRYCLPSPQSRDRLPSPQSPVQGLPPQSRYLPQYSDKAPSAARVVPIRLTFAGTLSGLRYPTSDLWLFDNNEATFAEPVRYPVTSALRPADGA